MPQSSQKNTFLIISVIVLAIAAGWYALNASSRAPQDAMQKESAMEEKDSPQMTEGEMKDTMMQKEEETKMEQKDAMMEKGTEAGDTSMDHGAMMHAGTYEPYAADKLAMAESGDVVLFFRASWCPMCRAADSDIRAHLSEIPAGLTILDVNYDASADLKKKYGVTYQHTFVQVDAQGNQLAKWSGSATLADIVSKVQ